ncbi:MAG: PAS domain-containing protein [Deltaproteobacteria bacterium]|nr:PAS domain-containing protein [Deltaproteobacteria bacterium]
MSQLFPILGLLSGLTFFGMGLWTARIRPITKVRRIFLWICMLFALWSLGFALHVGTADKSTAWFWYKVMTPGWTMGPALILSFCFLLTKRLLPAWVMALAHTVGAVFMLRFLWQPLAADIILTPFGWDEVHMPGDPWLLAFAIYAIGSACCGLLAIFFWGRRSDSVTERKQARLILLGGTVTTVIVSIANLGVQLAGIHELPGLAPIVTPIWGISMMIAIGKYDLLQLSPQIAAPQIIETMADALLLVDPDGRVVLANAAAGHLFNRKPSALHNTTVTSLLPGEKLLSPDIFNRRLSQGPLLAYNLVIPEGHSRVHINLSASAIRDRHNKHRGSLLLIRDITERKLTEASLVKADRLASMGLLAAGVAHEINNPMTVVLYNLESLLSDLAPRGTIALRSQPDEENLRESLEDAFEGACRVRDIVRDLRVFARMDEQPHSLVSVNQAVETALKMAFNPIKYKAHLVKELGQVAPVLADEGRLAQVFVNLLINAAQALDEKDAPTNEVRVRSWQEKSLVCVRVMDTGCGIPSDERDHIFDAFFTTKPPGVGTGLGLSISLQIIEEYGGQIEVESLPDKGSAFTVRLPIAPAA